MVDRPEDYKGCSLYYREINADKWMMPLNNIMKVKDRKSALKDYRASIYYRGNVASKPGQKEIPDYIIKGEENLGFESRGIYQKRVRHFVDGLVVGSSEFVNVYLQKMQDAGKYIRRKNPIKPGDESGLIGEGTILRPQNKSEVYVN
jgi:hypothetical protein